MLLIKNGRVCDPRSGTDKQLDILIDQDKIVRMAESISENDNSDVDILDVNGCIVAPGLIDVHVHFRDPGLTYKEDIMTGAEAAKHGGFTSVVCMANTKPVVDRIETLRSNMEKMKETGIHVYQAATITEGMKGQKLVSMKALYEAGAPGFTDDGVPIMDEKLVREAMEEAFRLRVPLSFHEEDPAYIKNNGINAGRVSDKLGIGGSDRQAEISMITRDLKLALETGAVINIQHISSKEGVALVREAKKEAAKRGLENIHAEATPHHFTLTEDAVLEKGTLAKMNPPLRTEEDRLAIIEGLRDGTIDLIATDHAPHSEEEKCKPLTEAPSGIIGLETSLQLGFTELVKKQGFSYSQLLEKMTWNPARTYQMVAGYLAENGPADIVIFDPEKEETMDHFVSKSNNSPFLGARLKGSIRYTICSGKIVYSNFAP